MSDVQIEQGKEEWSPEQWAEHTHGQEERWRLSYLDGGDDGSDGTYFQIETRSLLKLLWLAWRIRRKAAARKREAMIVERWS